MSLVLLALWSASLAHAETLYLTDSVQGLRWPDATQTTVSLGKGDEVEVLVKDGALVRVRKGTDFGWVPADKLVATKPEGGADGATAR